MKINKVTPDKHNYLGVLRYIPAAPEYIFFKGTLPKERLPSVAIVGTRKPTAYGTEVAAQLAGSLAQKGVVIISGLAIGIDSIAHRSALDVGGTTIAVLANSVDTIYPRSNIRLAEDMLAHNGAILSEYEPPCGPRTYQFLARNRIVSGLADAVVVIEAATRSGTLSTAAHALDQGKEVFAVPGNITSPLSSGCNNLIKQGAHPVTRVEDILEIVMPQAIQQQTTLLLGRNALEQHILQLIQSGVRDGDQLQQQTTAAIGEFNQTLTMMEIGGLIISLGANQWTISNH